MIDADWALLAELKPDLLRLLVAEVPVAVLDADRSARQRHEDAIHGGEPMPWYWAPIGPAGLPGRSRRR